MKSMLSPLYLRANQLYQWRGWVKLTVWALILCYALLVCIQAGGHTLLHFHVLTSYSSSSVSPNDPVGGGH